MVGLMFSHILKFIQLMFGFVLKKNPKVTIEFFFDILLDLKYTFVTENQTSTRV